MGTFNWRARRPLFTAARSRFLEIAGAWEAARFPFISRRLIIARECASRGSTIILRLELRFCSREIVAVWEIYQVGRTEYAFLMRMAYYNSSSCSGYSGLSKLH